MTRGVMVAIYLSDAPEGVNSWMVSIGPGGKVYSTGYLRCSAAHPDWNEPALITLAEIPVPYSTGDIDYLIVMFYSYEGTDRVIVDRLLRNVHLDEGSEYLFSYAENKLTLIPERETTIVTCARCGAMLRLTLAAPSEPAPVTSYCTVCGAIIGGGYVKVEVVGFSPVPWMTLLAAVAFSVGLAVTGVRIATKAMKQ